jgi:hypothetical protein
MAPPPPARVTAVDTDDIRIPARRDVIARCTHPGGGFPAAGRESRKEKTA